MRGTEKARASFYKVVSEGDVIPFSILDNIAINRPVVAESSATVISCLSL